MYSDSYALEVFDLVKRIFYQNINILNHLLEVFNPEQYILSEIYHNLCIIEEIFIFFLYQLPICINNRFIDRVNNNLIIVYNTKGNFSRRF